VTTEMFDIVEMPMLFDRPLGSSLDAGSDQLEEEG